MSYCKALAMVTVVLAISLPVNTFASSAKRPETDAEAIYNVLSAQDVSARKAVYRNLAPGMKAALWRLQLGRFAAEHVELDQRQRDLIAAAIQLLSEETFSSAGSDGELQWNLVQLEEQIRLTFPRALAAGVFARLGPAGYDNIVSDTPNLRIGVEARSTVPNCSCSQASDWCFSGTCGGGICYFVQSDCGFFWRYDCTGMCND